MDSDEKTEITNQQRRIEREYESTDEGIVVETETENEADENTMVKAESPELPDTLEASYDPEEGWYLFFALIVSKKRRTKVLLDLRSLIDDS